MKHTRLDLANGGNRSITLETLFHRLRLLTTNMHQVISDSVPVSEAQMHTFCRARDSIEWSLISFPVPSGDDGSLPRSQDDWTSVKAQALEAQRLAGLIYLNLVLRNCGPIGALLRALKSQLMNTAGTVRRGLAYTECRPKMAMWIYFVGGLLALDDHEELWFAEGITRTSRDAQLWTLEEIERALNELLWGDGLQTRIYKRLWQKVQEHRTG